MNDLQKNILEIMIEIDKICRKHNIKYFLDSGTALGAVRHRGFIPWDDDLDIGMLREDYEKFLKVAKDELDDKYFLQTMETEPNYYHMYAKVRKNNTLYIESAIRGLKMNHGIFVDIFPYDYVEKNKRYEKLSRFNYLQRLLFLRTVPNTTLLYSKTIKYFIRNMAYKLRRLLYKIKYNKIELVKEMENIIKNVDENEEMVLTCYPFLLMDFYLEKNILNSLIEIDFEKNKFFIMKNYDEYLTKMYGDYMIIPDEKDRITHNKVKVVI